MALVLQYPPLAIPQDLPRRAIITGRAGITWADWVFAATFDGANHAHSAIDYSLINAPITFPNPTGTPEIISDQAALLGYITQGALKGLNPTDHVWCPFNQAYVDVLKGDFTIDFICVPWTAEVPNYVIRAYQWIGVWEPNDPANQVWRITSDTDYVHFEFKSGGVIQKCSAVNFFSASATGVWIYVAVTRFQGVLRMFIGSSQNNNALMQLRTPLMTGLPDQPAGTPRLRINGDGTSWGVNGFIKLVRILKGAWYTSDATVSHPHNESWAFVPGMLKWPLVADAADTFPAPIVRLATAVLAPPFINADATFLAPKATNTTIKPGIVIDADNFFTQTPNQYPWNQDFTGGAPTLPDTGPALPMVRGGGFFPIFEGVTPLQTGFGKKITLALPTTRNHNDMLLAVIMTRQRIEFQPSSFCEPWSENESTFRYCPNMPDAWNTFEGNGMGTLGYNPSQTEPQHVYNFWYLGETSHYSTFDAYLGENMLGNAKWAMRRVDGTELPPIFFLPRFDFWKGCILRFSHVDKPVPFPEEQVYPLEWWMTHMVHGDYGTRIETGHPNPILPSQSGEANYQGGPYRDIQPGVFNGVWTGGGVGSHIDAQMRSGGLYSQPPHRNNLSFGGDPQNFYDSLYVHIVMTNDVGTIPNVPFYTPLFQYNDTDRGSIMACALNAPHGGAYQGDVGIGYTMPTIAQRLTGQLGCGNLVLDLPNSTEWATMTFVIAGAARRYVGLIKGNDPNFFAIYDEDGNFLATESFDYFPQADLRIPGYLLPQLFLDTLNEFIWQPTVTQGVGVDSVTVYTQYVEIISTGDPNDIQARIAQQWIEVISTP